MSDNFYSITLKQKYQLLNCFGAWRMDDDALLSSVTMCGANVQDHLDTYTDGKYINVEAYINSIRDDDTDTCDAETLTNLMIFITMQGSSETTEDYWNCDCLQNYIRCQSQGLCPTCGTERNKDNLDAHIKKIAEFKLFGEIGK